ncbi:MAG: hypothetical protein QW575_08580 [Thermoproteota archaeon]
MPTKKFVIGKENIRIGHKKPIKHLFCRFGRGILKELFISLQPKLLKSGKFKKFFEERRKLIIEGLNNYFQDI